MAIMGFQDTANWWANNVFGMGTQNQQDRLQENFANATWGDVRSGRGSRLDAGPFGGRIPDWAAPWKNEPGTLAWLESVQNDPRLPGILATLNSARDFNAQQDAARNQALGTLGGTRDAFSGMIDRFQNDPQRQAIGDRLTGMASPDYRAVSERQEEAFRNEIAQDFARAASMQEANQASRGGLHSGPETIGRASLQGQADSAALGISAEVDQQNEQARNFATQALNEFNNATYAIEGQLTNAMASIDREIANLEAGREGTLTDFTAFDQLIWAADQFERNLEQVDRQLDIMEQANQWDFMDTVNLIMGAYQAVPGFFQNIFNPGRFVNG